MRIAIVFRGHSFRSGGQFQHNVLDDIEPQKKASESQMTWVRGLKQFKDVKVDIFCCTYVNRHTRLLPDLYPGAKIQLVQSSPNIRQGDMLILSLNLAEPLHCYDYVIVTRFDIWLKQPIEFANIVYDSIQTQKIAYLFPLTEKLHNHKDGSYFFELDGSNPYRTVFQTFRDVHSLPPKVPDSFYMIPKNFFAYMQNPFLGRIYNHGFLQRIKISHPEFRWEEHVIFVSNEPSDDDPAKIQNPFYDFSSRRSILSR